jgi:hypothetical protein
MKSTRLFLPLAAAALAGLNVACEEDISQIGGALTTGETHIYVDTIVCDLQAVSVDNNVFDARSGSMMMGNLTAPEFGSLSCSFVTRLMPLAQIPDSIAADSETLGKFLTRLDSCKVLMNVTAGDYTGYDLAPQQVTLYELTKQLPSGITNAFNPEGYYNPASPLGRKNFTVSLAGSSDSIYMNNQGTPVDINIPTDYAARIFEKYVSDPEAFQWPQQFAEFIPGFYVKPTFGKGCVANVSKLFLYAYFHTVDTKTEKDDNDETITTTYNRPDSICLAITAPEVLSSNRIDYKVSDFLKKKAAEGETIITTPGGLGTKITFPAAKVIEEYNKQHSNLTIIGSLSMSIPASVIENDYGLGGAPYLLLIKTSKVEEFFKNNSLPDNKTSFYATYSSTIGGFQFSGLRPYLMELLEKDKIEAEDVEFSLVPVNITTESQTDSYYGTTSATYVTKCVPFTTKPSMMSLDTKNASVVFSFTSQIVE